MLSLESEKFCTVSNDIFSNEVDKFCNLEIDLSTLANENMIAEEGCELDEIVDGEITLIKDVVATLEGVSNDDDEITD